MPNPQTLQQAEKHNGGERPDQEQRNADQADANAKGRPAQQEVARQKISNLCRG